jgi:hypothetical protein
MAHMRTISATTADAIGENAPRRRHGASEWDNSLCTAELSRSGGSSDVKRSAIPREISMLKSWILPISRLDAPPETPKVYEYAYIPENVSTCDALRRTLGRLHRIGPARHPASDDGFRRFLQEYALRNDLASRSYPSDRGLPH